MKIKQRFQWLLSLSVAFLLGISLCQGQGSTQNPLMIPPQVKEIVADDGTKTWKIFFADGRVVDAATEQELTTTLKQYADSVYQQITQQMNNNPFDLTNEFRNLLNGLSNGGSSSLSSLLGGGSFNMDETDRELSGLIGEQVSSIMQGLSDQITALATDLLNQAVGQILNASPIGEVKSLKDLLKEGYTKEQKIQYQQYRVNYEEKKARTALSSTFTKYYDQLGINKTLQRLNQRSTLITTLIAKPEFTAKERATARQALGLYTDQDDLVEEVKTACNLNGGTVWMGEAERVKVLEYAKKEMEKREKAILNLYGTLANAYVYRQRDIARKRAVAGLYKSDTQLNRTVQAMKP